ncbi:MAG: hypothetical protein WBO35_01655, partial [Candidatus Saccharimonadales bacterium]
EYNARAMFCYFYRKKVGFLHLFLEKDGVCFFAKRRLYLYLFGQKEHTPSLLHTTPSVLTIDISTMV